MAQKSKEGGKDRKSWKRGSCEGWMGWDLLAVSCAGDRGQSDGREAINRGEMEDNRRLVKSNVVDRRSDVVDPLLPERHRAWLQSIAAEPVEEDT